jgi:hypothetical protein
MATNWRKQQLQLENAYAQAMLHEDGIVETTTKRQWKNGTRQFKLPTGELLATYKSGYVRRCDSSDRIWQLNPKYKRKVRWVFLDGTELVTKEYTTWSRALIWSGLARLNFLHKYAKKNYLNK